MHAIKIDFSWAVTFICIILFSFNFWLFYPGYLTNDWTFLIKYLPLDNHQPIIYPLLLKKIFNAFGYHLYYPLLFNLIPFYLGIYVLVLGCWKKYKSKWCLLGLSPILIGNIFFSNMFGHCSFSSPTFIFFLWSLLIYQLLTKITFKNSIIVFFAFIIAILSRHNAIIQVFPVCLVYSWIIIQKMQKSHRLLKYIGLLFLSSVISIFITIGIPNLLRKQETYPSSHIFLHQIAGACVPNQDDTCFDQKWYRHKKTFSDVATEYFTNPLDADRMNRSWHPNHPFKRSKLNNLEKKWIESIIKYPSSYLIHIFNFIKKMWFSTKTQQFEVSLEENSRIIPQKDTHQLKAKIPHNELFYKASDLKITIYNFLKKILPIIPIFCFVFPNFIIFGISGFLFFKKKNLFLLYSLSSSIAGISSSIIFCIFSPVPMGRYMYPILISTLMAFIGLIVYWIQTKKKTNRPSQINSIITNKKHY